MIYGNIRTSDFAVKTLSTPCCHTRIELLSEPAVQFNTVLLQYTKVYDRVWENQPCIATHMVLFQEIHIYVPF